MRSISKNEQLTIKFSSNSNCENELNTVRLLFKRNFVIFYEWSLVLVTGFWIWWIYWWVAMIFFRWFISDCSFCWVDSMDCSDIMDNQAWNWQGRSFKIGELVFLGINILLQSCVTWFGNMFCDMLVIQSS